MMYIKMSSSCATNIWMRFSWILAVAVSMFFYGHSVMLNIRAVGHDIRKAVVDGWDVQNVIASDIQEGWSPFFSQ